MKMMIYNWLPLIDQKYKFWTQNKNFTNGYNQKTCNDGGSEFVANICCS